ncbi:MAG TPA: hypothetical protein VG938_03160 [Verrucomicrobiae bacterium]|jgi:hypothetical protein|nr:hypothetical protein [Verrucomicrobiae bacterium]
MGLNEDFPVQKQFRFKAFAWIIALLGCGLVFSGCGKSKTSAAQTPPSVSETPAPAVADTPAPSTAADTATAGQPAAAAPGSRPLTTANGSPDLSELNRTMIRWIVRNRRAPANFAEFAATAGVTIPPAPAGQKYVIGSDKHVLLVPQ